MNTKYFIKTAIGRLFLCFILFLQTQFSFAQVSVDIQSKQDSLLANFAKPSCFIIKGKVENYSKDFFEFASTTYLNNVRMAVPIKDDGTFEAEFAVSKVQDIYLYLNDDAITFTVGERDTLNVFWDDKDFKNSFNIYSNIRDRNSILKVQWEVYLKHRKSLMALMQDLYEKRSVYTELEKFNLINQEYTNVVFTILNLSEKGKLPLNEVLYNQYFIFCDQLLDAGLLEKYSLHLPADVKEIVPDTILKYEGKEYKFNLYPILGNVQGFRTENDNMFDNVPSYRQFIYNWINRSGTFVSYIPTIQYQKPTNFTFKAYYAAKTHLKSEKIQDWYITKRIIQGFSYYNFNDVELVYNLFYPECKTTFFKEALYEHYKAIKLLKPGNAAPAFTLKDENGKLVSLSDFKGKLVYIDFWGVYCGPCIGDIEQYVPKVHEFYKDKDIVFINICVDVNESKWKSALKKYNLKGVNLLAEGWTKHPVVNAYNVTGIPHYVLIDKDGVIVNNNAERPSELSRKFGSNKIDSQLGL